ncbi:3-deoxy-7-phosphoheptulonate synthase [Dictyobacter kobayashii]|uniref:3-deoxy-7-phosphoheptulonate synthase n=1 Tax=Dictyobacter kobayashii TaxID=2014872 RepID=A0A402AVQ8_9CHLR|nr:3-deoxy-7-phosphoheptulonate synthase [Dictyobacter kobayashii]GCE23103.1 3-deoxy-7-phosphoheptulonate synthase [Dictyobacter kobayashii]
MFIVMKPSCSRSDIDSVLAVLEKHQLAGTLSNESDATIIQVLETPQAPISKEDINELKKQVTQKIKVLAGVERIPTITRPYKLASRDFHPKDTIVRVPAACTAQGYVEIGGQNVVMMAGPCTVESEKQLLTTAEAVLEKGAVILRGGAFKPSTSPYGYRGMGLEGLKLLAKARDTFGLAVITEVMTPTDVSLVSEYADILQIGTRNMQNYMLLDEVGRSNMPVVLKRGMSAKIEEWLLAAEYILAQGNKNVILCERGIRTFESATRNTMDLSAIPVVKNLSHLPIISDPSQGTGHRHLVEAMSLASVTAGSDGLLVEVHPNPEEALKDGAQSLTIGQYQQLMARLNGVALAVGRSVTKPAFFSALSA